MMSPEAVDRRSDHCSFPEGSKRLGTWIKGVKSAEPLIGQGTLSIPQVQAIVRQFR